MQLPVKDFTSKLDNQISLIEKQLVSANSLEIKRLASMITFRKSPDALKGYIKLSGCHTADFIERACAYNKKIMMSYEEISYSKLKGSMLEKIAAKYKPVALLFRFLSVAAKGAKASMHNEGKKGVLGGYITDELYQSPELFPDFERFENNLSYFEQLKRKSAGTMEMRNRYRRVLNLSLSEERIAYFKNLRHRGIGTPHNPIFIASIGGGTGSVEMDIQQNLRENHNLYSRIAIFDVVDQNRINGSFFAKMRGADICWVIQKLGEDDLLTQLSNATFDTFLSIPLSGIDAYGNSAVVAENCCWLFHHVLMSGLWAKFNDENIVKLLTICKRMMHPVAEAVVTLSRNKFMDKHSHEMDIPSMKIMDHLGHDKNGVWYRSIESLSQSSLLENGGFMLTNKLDGPIFPVISIAPINPNFRFAQI